MRHRDVKIPEAGKIYSFNEGNYAMWDKPTRDYMDSLKVSCHADLDLLL